MVAGWGKLDGAILAGGRVDLHLDAKDVGTQSYALPARFPRIEGTKFEISWVSAKKEYWRDTSTITKGLTTEIMREQGGIRLYLDGFRVYPYGDQNDDWLSINMDVARRVSSADRILNDVSMALGVENSRPMLNHPRNENLIGRVYISSKSGNVFDVKLNREGLVQNEAFDQLTQVLRLSLQWMVLHYNKFLILFGARSIEAAGKEFKAAMEHYNHRALTAAPERSVSLVQKALEVITVEARRAAQILPEADRKRAENSLTSASKLIHRSFTQTETYLNILRGVASTGVLMFSFSHEIKNLIGRLETHANSLDRLAEKLPSRGKAEMNEFAQSLRQTRDRLDQQVALFGALSRKTADTERRMVAVKSICHEVIQGFGYLIDEYNMNKPVLDIPQDMRIGPMLEIELYSIFVNLVSNAIKANLAGQGKSMLIQAVKVNGKMALRVLDDGMGLPLGLQQKVFEPLAADPEGRLYSALSRRVADEDLAALGRGSGLGLSIVRGIAETYGGTAHFKSADPPWRTCVEVILP
jgi:signal transduction histidine kinase